MSRQLDVKPLGPLLPLLCLAACPAPTPDPMSEDPYKGLSRTYARTCKVTGAPTEPPRLKLTRVLSGTGVTKPVHMLPANDGSGRVFIVSQPGRIYMARAITETGTMEEWLDITDRVDDGPNEAGLLSLALDPKFSRNGRIYVNYTRTQGGQLQTAISRFTATPPATGRPDRASETVLLTIDQPFGNHNGGQIAFGPDGMLYIGMGDGGSGGDPYNYGQDMSTLHGKILRIDVSAGGTSYAVPRDNPFIAQAGARPEIWALGFRNPWRFSFDPADGALWAADVGQGMREEIDIVERGKNYGWRCMEGTLVFNNEASCRQKIMARALTAPVHEYPRADGKSVTGGHVYRGRQIANLVGTYVFADFEFGTIWGLSAAPNGGWTRKTLVEKAGLISSFGLDGDGELYVLEWLSARDGLGRIYRVSSADPPPPRVEKGWPDRLSETGCFSDVPARRLAAGVLSYSVNMPLFSDGADKERGLALPEGGQIGFSGDGAWSLPDGTILIKTFVLSGRPVETRFLVRAGAEWRGATYRWDEAGTEAHLLGGGLTTMVAGQMWTFPSRMECGACHTQASGHVLGLSTPQMNRSHDVFGTGRPLSQIEALARLGYFTAAPGKPPGQLGRFPALDDGSAGAATRARAYLHANCAHCHMPGGLASATIDLRHGTALADTKACNMPAQQGDLGVPGAHIIRAGEPERSTLWLRMVTSDPTFRMPNVATNQVHGEASEIIKTWIKELTGCLE